MVQRGKASTITNSIPCSFAWQSKPRPETALVSILFHQLVKWPYTLSVPLASRLLVGGLDGGDTVLREKEDKVNEEDWAPAGWRDSVALDHAASKNDKQEDSLKAESVLRFFLLLCDGDGVGRQRARGPWPELTSSGRSRVKYGCVWGKIFFFFFYFFFFFSFFWLGAGGGCNTKSFIHIRDFLMRKEKNRKKTPKKTNNLTRF